MKCDTQITGNTGLYYCCYRLSRLGWNVMPTARNARGVDIVIYTQDASRYLGIQVKTLSKRAAVPLGKSLDKVMGGLLGHHQPGCDLTSRPCDAAKGG